MISLNLFAVRFQYMLMGRITVEGYEGQFEIRFKEANGRIKDVIVVHENWRTSTSATRIRPILILLFEPTGEGHCISQQEDSGFDFLDISSLAARTTALLNYNYCRTPVVRH